MITMISDYVNRLKELDNLEFNSFTTGAFSLGLVDRKICYLSDKSRYILYEDITRIDFTSLYANIQVGLFNEGLIGKEWEDDIARVKWFLKNRDNLKLLKSDEYKKWIVHCNSLYMKIRSPYVVEYIDMFYNDLIKKYCDLVIYNDVDILYLNIDKVSFQTKEYISELKYFTYDIQFIDYLYVENRKRYIEQEDSGVINSKGFRDEDKKEYILNIIKMENRRRKLEILEI